MARQYNTKRSEQRGGVARQFLIVAVTFLSGYLTASYLNVDTVSHWVKNQSLASYEAKKQPVKHEPAPAQIPPKPKFEFYTLLANEKKSAPSSNTPRGATVVAAGNPAKAAVVAATISSHSLKNTASQPVALKPVRNAVINSSAGKSAFMVQVAAFKARHEAEQMKGLLTLKGFNVAVVSVTQPKGTWFRVVVGPYSNRSLAQKAQTVLAKNERLKGMVISG